MSQRPSGRTPTYLCKFSGESEKSFLIGRKTTARHMIC